VRPSKREKPRPVAKRRSTPTGGGARRGGVSEASRRAKWQKEQERAREKREAKRAAERRKVKRLGEERAAWEEATAARRRAKARREAMKKDPEGVRKQAEALEKLLEINRAAAERLKLGKGAVKGHVYEDGRVVVQLQIPAKKRSLVEVERALRGEQSAEVPLFPDGTYLEGNVLFDPTGELAEKVKKDDTAFPKFRGIRKAKIRPKGRCRKVLPDGQRCIRKAGHGGKHQGEYVGKSRLQMWGTKNPVAGLFNMDEQIARLKDSGLHPEFFQIKTSISIDGSQPFTRIKPPVGKKRGQK
jgi:hypothetical protein